MQRSLTYYYIEHVSPLGGAGTLQWVTESIFHVLTKRGAAFHVSNESMKDSSNLSAYIQLLHPQR